MPTPAEEYLINYVLKLQELNNREIEIPQDNIETILEDPKTYALDWIETNLILVLPEIIDAFKSGSEFAKKLDKL